MPTAQLSRSKEVQKAVFLLEGCGDQAERDIRTAKSARKPFASAQDEKHDLIKQVVLCFDLRFSK